MNIKKKSYKNKFFITQQPVIIDEEQRIFRVKASTGDYDRDNDRVNPEKWRLSKYNPPFVDSHSTRSTYDKRLGEVVNAFYENGIWYNDVKLDVPEGDPNSWTEGEKLANRIWKLVKANKDIRVSVGFKPDVEKIVQNEKGGYDFNGQEQFELSVVLVPANENAGTKEMSKNELKKELDELKNIVKELKENIENKDKSIKQLQEIVRKEQKKTLNFKIKTKKLNGLKI